MCGRYVIAKATSDLLPSLLDGLPPLRDDYNVAPTTAVPVVRERHDGRELVEARWGLTPSWYPDLKKRPQPINARIESVATSGMFRRPFASRRCIVPALGYYEWTVTDSGKQPHFIHEPDGALAMAGVMSAWPDPSKEEDDPDRWVLSMAIITRDAHVAPGEVHDRMPACLTPDSFDDWLGDHLGPDELLALLERDSHEIAHDLVQHEVTRDANNVRNNGAYLIDPLA
ncbi:SOS response-associated peptidase [Frigoribacterium sp. 2-23]|uniref:SOS response-associated peptidase n=1 Tax=Frigoribacterium sp. 2-23 TaxID=3415006 RepID=UPI003C6F04A4